MGKRHNQSDPWHCPHSDCHEHDNIIYKYNQNVIRLFILDETDLGDFAMSGLAEPSGLALDSQGNVAVTHEADVASVIQTS
jgi:hypothetical protein